jgi:hypothetical protein
MSRRAARRAFAMVVLPAPEGLERMIGKQLPGPLLIPG